MAGVVGLGIVALVMLGVLVQPQVAWNEAAEHSKRFWCVWALTFVTVGLLPGLVVWAEDGGEILAGWSLIWLLVCCTGAVLQPALWTDLLETRRSRARRASRTLVPALARQPEIRQPEIRWHAPTASVHPHTAAGYTRMGTSS